MLKRRQALSLLDQEAYAKAWTVKALEFLTTQNYQTIAGYMPIQGELDVLALLEALRDSGKTILLPRTPEIPDALTFHEYHTDQLKSGLYGIQQPLSHCPQHCPDIILVPLVAFDEARNRLGYGGGYYDRTLTAIAPPPLTLGCAYDFQKVDMLPTEAHDRQLDRVIALNH